MSPAEILAVVIQIMALFPTVEPALVQAIRDFESLVSTGTTSQADIDALLNRVKSQSAMIQAMD